MTTPETPSPELSRIYDDSSVRRMGYSILLVVFVGIGSWAAFAPLHSAAMAPGVVTVKSYRKTVQHLEGGIVSELHVRDGEYVKKGDPLLTLEPTQVQAEVELLRNQKVAIEALQARLMAELKKQPLQIPAEVSKNPRAQEAWQAEYEIFQTQRQAREGEIHILEQTVGQLSEQINGLQSIIRSKQQLEKSYQEEVEDLKALLKEGFTDKLRLREQERAISRLTAEIADHNSAISQAQQRRNEAQLQILQLNKKLIQENTSKLADAQTQLYDINERLRTVEDRMQRSVVRAPESGTVLGLSIHTIGGVIASGHPILEIVPDAADLIIEAHLSPNDINRIQVGMPVDIRFSVFNSATTPVIEGTLEHVSADRVYDEATRQSYYLARVQLTDKGKKALQDHQLLPGMPAEVMINTGSRSLLSYLLKPATNWMARSLNED